MALYFIIQNFSDRIGERNQFNSVIAIFHDPIVIDGVILRVLIEGVVTTLNRNTSFTIALNGSIVNHKQSIATVVAEKHSNSICVQNFTSPNF